MLSHPGLSRFAGLAFAAAFSSLALHAEPIIGLVSTLAGQNAIIRFDSATPGSATAPLAVTGLNNPSEFLFGIDIRPTTGVLYGLTDAGNLYTINPFTGVASFQFALTTAPTPGSYGIDFNPVPDLAGMASLRLVNAGDQNLRANVNNGVTNVDSAITNDAMEPGLNPAIVASAYANNDVNPMTGTTLFGIDSDTDTLLRATNANAGTYVTVGSLGIDVIDLLGFDISRSGIAYAATNDMSGLVSAFRTINTMTGGQTFVGNIASVSGDQITVRGISAAVPEPSTFALLGAGLFGIVAFARRRRA